MSYKPLPPMMPIWIFSMGVAASLQHLLDEPPAIALADEARGDVRVVLEENQVAPVDGLADESLLEREGLHRKQVVAHHPGVLEMRGGGNEIGDEDGRAISRFDEHNLVLPGVA